MKKIAALILTLALIATLSVASFAAVTEIPGSEGKDLGLNYAPVVPSAATVYSIDITWDSDLSFDYSAGNQGAWNPETHQYGAVSGADWTDDKVAVTVTNHSNAALVASIEIADADGEDGVTVAADKDTDNLATAVGTDVANPPAVTFTLTASGTPAAAITKVATATVKITLPVA